MDPRDFETCVADYYADLYRFAYSLAKNESDACDLTQQAFAILAQKGGEIRDTAKRKHWLFTTLYREFLKCSARAKRQPTMEECDLESHSPPAASDAMRTAEHHEILAALASLEEAPRAILSLFYLDDCSYKEIAEILNVPIGTVKSRMARGIAQLQSILSKGTRQNK